MIKKRTAITLLALSAVTILSAFVCVKRVHGSFFHTEADVTTYGITMNSTKNEFFSGTGSTKHSGDATIQTDLGNDINFTYSNLAGGSSSVWHMLDKENSYFYNTTPIHGLKTLSATFTSADKSFKIFWSNTQEFSDDKSQTLTSNTSAVSFNFNLDYPTYFKFTNESGMNLSITNLSLGLTCLNNYPTLTRSSADTKMGSVSGPNGVIKSGQNVTIVATPNTGYRFVNWTTPSSQVVSTSTSYTFTMGNDDLNYIANFTYQTYTLTISSESTTKGTVSNSSGSYNYCDELTITAYPLEGYSFAGWYKNNQLVSQSNPYTFSMPYSNTTYVAKFSSNQYTISLTNNNPELGSITGSGSYAYTSVVTLNAIPNTGVAFTGWFNGSTLLSSNTKYTFSMPHNNLVIIAKFAYAPYTVTININDSTMGSVTGAGTYIYNQEVSLVATPAEHYSFFGWYNNNQFVSSDLTLTFNMPTSSLTYEARFVQNYYINAYSDDESLGTVIAPTEWGVGMEVTVSAIGNGTYALDYWADENYDELAFTASYSFIMPNHNIELIAVFNQGYTLTITTNNPNNCITTGSGLYVPGRPVVASFDYQSGIFEGWYDSNDNLVTKSNPYQFSMPSNDYLLEARFVSQEIEDAILGKYPVLSDDGKTVTFGLYPQKVVDDAPLISLLNSLPESNVRANGWYYLNGLYYAKINAILNNKTEYEEPDYNNKVHTFNNGNSINSGTAYWFECSSIQWDVIKTNGDIYTLISSMCLDGQYYAYGCDSNYHERTDYDTSDIRPWLNDAFYNSAFGLNKAPIQRTQVEFNRADPYDDPDIGTVNDYVFLPDKLNGDVPKTSKTTDFARARGAYYNTASGEYQYNGTYITRAVRSSKTDMYDYNYCGSLGIHRWLSSIRFAVRPQIVVTIPNN